MRVVKFVWNQKINADANYSLQQELVVADDADPKQLGADLLAWVDSFQEGVRQEALGE